MLVDALSAEAANFIRVGWSVEPLQGVVSAYRQSDPGLRWTVFLDGEIAAMFGCAPGGMWGEGCPWLVSAPVLERAKLRFIRQSRAYIARMLDCYPLLAAHVYRGNKPLIAWMRWSGFVFHDVSEMFCRGELSVLSCAWYRATAGERGAAR